ncbi:hypothetical protein ABFZ85_14675 [Hyphococcus formosus]|uniref:hypothetical protein n=1 Tax=Hyphococcus formosus TaxID=3143534 RepID=UPI00398BAF6A
MSLKDAANLLGMSKTTAGRAYRELEEKGFIVNTFAGDWYGRKAATWALTFETQDLPRRALRPSNDWKVWSERHPKKAKKK